MRDVPTTLRLAGGLALIALALSGANCNPGQVADDASRASGSASQEVAPIAPAAPELRPPSRRPSPTGFGASGSVAPTSDDPIELLERTVGEYRTWTCRLIDIAVAAQDGDVTKQEIATQAAQEVAGAVPPLRRRQAVLAVDKLMSGDPSALKDLACI
jgi:hypothetical protein